MANRVSIVPKGFELTAHPVFFKYKPVCERSDRLEDISPNLSEVVSKSGGEINEFCQNSSSSTENNCIDPSLVCPICLERIDDSSTLGYCAHSFCFRCIMAWFDVKVSCPVCKIESSHIIKSCELTRHHPHGIKILKIVSHKAKSEEIDNIKKLKLKNSIGRHEVLSSLLNGHNICMNKLSDLSDIYLNRKKRRLED